MFMQRNEKLSRHNEVLHEEITLRTLSIKKEHDQTKIHMVNAADKN